MNKGYIGLKDIAAEANLSVAAVSMALRGKSSVSPSTRKRVKAIAQRMGYVPDPALGALSAYRNRISTKHDFNVIAMISDWKGAKTWSASSSARELIQGAEERAASLGYRLECFGAYMDGMHPKRLVQILEARGIRGVIMAPFENPEVKFGWPWQSFSVVTIERSSLSENLLYVVPNYYSDMLMVLDQLKKRGYQRPGLVLDRTLAHRVFHLWEAAYEVGCKQRDFKELPILITDSKKFRESAFSWLKHHEPDVIIAKCPAIIEILHQHKTPFPDSIGYVSLNVHDDFPGVSGILQNRSTMGAAAVDLLNSNMKLNHLGAPKVAQGVVVDGSWTEGEIPSIRSIQS